MAYRRDIPFNLELSSNGDIAVIEDIEAINQSIYSILISNTTSKSIETDFGANISKYLFENSTPPQFLEYSIKEDIENSLIEFEPDIIINNIEVTVDRIEYKMTFDIEYTLKDGLTTGSFHEDLSLENIR